MPQVNPDILRWARETAGLTLEDAVGKLRIGDAKGVPATDRLKALEQGSQQPSRAMLERMVKQYRRPLVAFYLAQPPRRSDQCRDFRTVGASRSTRRESLLDALVRNVQARQGLLGSALLDDDEDATPLSFPGSATITTPVERVVEAMRDTLEVRLADYRKARDADTGFRLLRRRAEEAGVSVLLLGDLGSHHTRLDVDVFRGFALADDFVPFVVVNPADSPGAKSFTLIHELAHLWLGESRISGGSPRSTDPVEVFCNNVASLFLLPDEELADFHRPSQDDLGRWAQQIRTFAGPRNISSSMVAYRLHRAAVIDAGTWRGLRRLFHRSWRDAQAKKKERSKASDGGPSYHILVRNKLGPVLIETVFRLMASGALSATKGARVLGVNPRNAHTIRAGG